LEFVATDRATIKKGLDPPVLHQLTARPLTDGWLLSGSLAGLVLTVRRSHTDATLSQDNLRECFRDECYLQKREDKG
jgi:hypothetical protein